jgi:hypothetical protein
MGEFYLIDSWAGTVATKGTGTESAEGTGTESTEATGNTEM